MHIVCKSTSRVFHFCPGTPQNPASNTAAAVSMTTAQQSTPPTAASTGSVGGQQATPGSSLADITSSVRAHVCVCVCVRVLHVFQTRFVNIDLFHIHVCIHDIVHVDKKFFFVMIVS